MLFSFVPKQTTPFGSQKIFFDLIWKRLHPELSLEYEGKKGPPQKPAPTKPRPATKVPKKSRGRTRAITDDAHSLDMLRRHTVQDLDTNNTSLSQARTPLPHLPSPPIIHRGACLASQAVYQDEARPNKELCMIPKKRYLCSHPYTESDVSVAMILANGFGRNADKGSSNKLTGEESW